MTLNSTLGPCEAGVEVLKNMSGSGERAGLLPLDFLFLTAAFSP